MVNRKNRVAAFLYSPRVLPAAFTDHELYLHSLRSCMVETLFVLRDAASMTDVELAKVTQLVEILTERFEDLRNR